MIFDTVRELLAHQLEVDPETITPDTDIFDDLGADSLDVVELVMSIEEEYDIVITDERAGNVRTVAQVVEMLEDLINRLGAGSTPCIRVYNKCDRYIGVLPRGENIVCISARTGEGTAELVKKIAEILGRESRRVTLLLPYDKAGIADTLRREAAVLSVEYGEDGVTVEAVVKPELWGLVRGYVQEGE